MTLSLVNTSSPRVLLWIHTVIIAPWNLNTGISLLIVEHTRICYFGQMYNNRYIENWHWWARVECRALTQYESCSQYCWWNTAWWNHTPAECMIKVSLLRKSTCASDMIVNRVHWNLRLIVICMVTRKQERKRWTHVMVLGIHVCLHVFRCDMRVNKWLPVCQHKETCTTRGEQCSPINNYKQSNTN